MKRYLKNKNMLTDEEIKKLHEAKVCIIGCGGLGGYVIEELTRLGFLNLTLVDFDVFDETNLNRQLLATHKTLNKKKSEVAGQRVLEVSDGSRVRVIDERFDESNCSRIVGGHNIVIDALDNAESKLLLEKTCRELNIPLIHGAIGGWYGQVAVIRPGDDTLSKIYDSKSPGIERELGNPSFTPAVISSIMVSETLKLYLGKPALASGEVWMIDLLNNSTHIITLI